MTATLREQASALIGLRAKLFLRRFLRERQWGRAVIGVVAAAMAGFFISSRNAASPDAKNPASASDTTRPRAVRVTRARAPSVWLLAKARLMAACSSMSDPFPGRMLSPLMS